MPLLSFFPQAQDTFITSLKKEWDLRSPCLLGKEIVSIYFGGGTPSLLPAQKFENILEMIQKGPASISSNCEITLEANPENITLSSMQGFVRAGINRASIGVQSFDDKLLKSLGRTHCSKKAKQAIDSAKKSGIANLSIDLMYELPHQRLESWKKSLLEVANLPITHLSLYNLVFEPGTVFHKKRKLLSPSLPSEKQSLQMLNLAVKYLESFGLNRYEISAFCKPGYESLHNTGYWQGRPFLGLGPSAFSYWQGRRFQNIAHLKKYEKALLQDTLPENFEENLPFEKKQKELLALELRLLRGVDMNLFQARAGLLSPSLQKSIQDLLTKNLLKQKNSNLHLSEEGLLFYDTVASELM